MNTSVSIRTSEGCKTTLVKRQHREYQGTNQTIQGEHHETESNI